MSLVPAICTQCGAKIEVDNNHEAGICKYCGTAFITEKAINKYTTYITNNNSFAGATINITGANIDNLLNLAKAAISSNNAKEALDYANRALEIDSTCTDAWIIKMQAIALSITLGDSKIDEIRSCGKNAINFAPEDKKSETTNKVYDNYLIISQRIMLFALAKINDTDQLKQAWSRVGVSLVAISAVQQADAKIRQVIELMANAAINLKTSVEIECIKGNDDFQTKVKQLADFYIAFCKADQARTKIYGLTPEDLNADATSIRRNNLSIITKGLQTENVVNVTEIDHSKTSSGCYIATCVYGSYDCPQVWTLRRFRDYHLDKSWYGRTFIRYYYAISPTLVRWFGNRMWFRTICQKILDRMVSKLNYHGIVNTPYQDKY